MQKTVGHYTLALRDPIEQEGASIEDAAVRAVLRETKGYPYFLQEWGHQCWDIAQNSMITESDAHKASALAIKSLDDGFFKVRFDRLKPKEREYVIAMAKLRHGPYRSSDVAEVLKETVQSLGPRRAKIISKGMIYSPSPGDIAFTVPLFEEYLTRNFRDGAIAAGNLSL